ncbi:MAG: DUF4179 domain-containing protein [Dehalococcoidia bacterium]|nr:DUF4179 domain-containing protein [Dehalococcoidia bacterium]
MLHLLRRKTHPTPSEGDPPAAAALANDLGLLFLTLANPLGRPPAYEWGQVAGVPAAAAAGRRARRLAGGLIAGLAALVLTAAGYVAVTNVDLADRLFANFGSTAGQSGVYPIGVSQTIDGITVTVDHVVFDGTPIEERSTAGSVLEHVPLMVQFTVSGLSGDARAHSVGDESLSSGGLELRRIGGVGLRGQSDVLDRELPPGTEQMLYAYDTTGIAFGSGSLHLRLAVTVTRRGDQGSEAVGQETPGLVTPAAEPIEPPIRFSFEFSVPTN